jgi:hypothetical protein
MLDRFISSIHVERYYILVKETNSCGVTLLTGGYRFLMKAAVFLTYEQKYGIFTLNVCK